MAIGEWSVRWLFAEPLPAEVEPVTLTWWMHRRVDVDRLPDRRVVIEFDYQGADATTPKAPHEVTAIGGPNTKVRNIHK